MLQIPTLGEGIEALNLPTCKTFTIMKLDKVLYTASTHTTGGRDGAGKSSDGALDVKLSKPGAGKPGTNPEQLLAVGWSACFMGAIAFAAGNLKVTLPPDLAVDAEIDLGTVDTGYALQARLNVSLPGVDRETAQTLVTTAHQTCPYSKATRGNIDVEIRVI